MFDCPKRMLNGLPPDPHRVREVIEAGLHRFENSFILPARHAPLLAWGETFFDCAIFAV